jgi:uncharacterized OB-fold protein
MPFKSSVPLFWRLKDSKYRLVGTICNTCKETFFPRKNLCPNCRRRGNLEDYQFNGEGRIISYTIIRVPPEGFEKYSPYAVALIELNGGSRISGQMTGDIGKVETGRKVNAVFRRMYEDGSGGLIHYGLKWEIAE